MPSVVYAPADRPSCEVLVDGVWRYGEVHMWERREDGWWASVSWQPERGHSYHRGQFPQAVVSQLDDLTPYLGDVPASTPRAAP